MTAPALPEGVARCAWECAYVLSDEAADDLSIDQRILVEAVRLIGEPGLDYPVAGEIIALYCANRPTRT